MNDPEYILVDDIGTLATLVQTDLALPNLNYQYGYLKELNETLQQQNDSSEDVEKKYPLIWVLQPFIIQRNTNNYYGIVRDLRIFIINQSDPDKKAKQRMTDNFKPIIYPIYRNFLKQIDISVNFSTMGIQSIRHNLVDRYWIQDIGLDDVIDCLEMNFSELYINNNPNCLPFKSF